MDKLVTLDNLSTFKSELERTGTTVTQETDTIDYSTYSDYTETVVEGNVEDDMLVESSNISEANGVLMVNGIQRIIADSELYDSINGLQETAPTAGEGIEISEDGTISLKDGE